MGDDPLQDPPDSVNGRTATGDHEPEPTEAELFPAGSLAGDAITPQTFIRKGLPVRVTVALSRAEVPTKAGLLNPDKAGRVLVDYVPGGKHDVPEREGGSATGKVIGWTIRQELRASFVTDANDDAALARNAFAALLATDAPRAGALLAELRQMAESEIGAPA